MLYFNTVSISKAVLKSLRIHLDLELIAQSTSFMYILFNFILKYFIFKPNIGLEFTTSR